MNLLSITLSKYPNAQDMFIKCIKALGTWYHPIEYQWFVFTNKSVDEVADRFMPYFKDGNGGQFIVTSCYSGMNGWAPIKFWDWLKDPEKSNQVEKKKPNDGHKDLPKTETDKEDLLVKTDQF